MTMLACSGEGWLAGGCCVACATALGEDRARAVVAAAATGADKQLFLQCFVVGATALCRTRDVAIGDPVAEADDHDALLVLAVPAVPLTAKWSGNVDRVQCNTNRSYLQ